MAMNHIEIHGHLGRDPELTEHEGQNGPYKKVNFSVAVSRSFGDGTDWFYCVMYGNRAEVVEKFFKKGSQIIVQGRMESYKPKKDPDRTAWLLKVEDFDFCDKQGGSESERPSASDVPESMEEVNEDVPF